MSRERTCHVCVKPARVGSFFCWHHDPAMEGERERAAKKRLERWDKNRKGLAMSIEAARAWMNAPNGVVVFRREEFRVKEMAEVR